MSAEDLRPLLSPRSIAVIGASEGPRHGGEVMRSLRELGFSGELFPVNPRYGTVYGLPCHPNLKAVGRPVDCVVVAVGREMVPEILRQAAAIGARSAIVLSGGFRETGPAGRQSEDEVVSFARDHGIRLLGPNNIGLLVKTWGKVTWVDTANQCFYIDDGSRIPAGTTRSDNGQTVYGVRVGYSGLATGVAPVTPPAENDYVLVTGICSTIRYTVGDDIRPNVRVRSGADISNLN